MPSALKFLCLAGWIATLFLFVGCGDVPPVTTPQPPKPIAPASPQQTSSTLSGGTPVPSASDDVETSTPPVVAKSTEPDRELLESRGIHRHQSNRMVLYSDLPAADVASLPGFVDQFIRITDEFLGPPPPKLTQDSRPILGYLMKDQSLFDRLKLLPEKIPAHHTGWHLDHQIWMQHQASPYYERHLLFHEVVHAILNVRGVRGLSPWLEEGLAELLATHRLDGTLIQWAGIPRDQNEFHGWGRIDEIQTHVQTHSFYSPDDIAAWPYDKFVTSEAYAWSWAICFYLTEHPQYSEDFRRWLQLSLEGNPDPLLPWHAWTPEQQAEWKLFLEELDYGMDLKTWAVEFGRPSTAELKDFSVKSDRGWQSTGWEAHVGQTYLPDFTGEISLNTNSPDWTSTAPGISFHYASGQPIGRLLGRLLVTNADGSRHFGPIIPLGELKTWKPAESGILFLRINDRYADLADNSGEYRMTLGPQP